MGWQPLLDATIFLADNRVRKRMPATGIDKDEGGSMYVLSL